MQEINLLIKLRTMNNKKNIVKEFREQFETAGRVGLFLVVLTIFGVLLGQNAIELRNSLKGDDISVSQVDLETIKQEYIFKNDTEVPDFAKNKSELDEAEIDNMIKYLEDSLLTLAAESQALQAL